MLETISIPARAKLRVSHQRAYDFDDKTGLWVFKPVDIAADLEEYGNIVTNAGRVTLHTYCYGTTSRTNGLNYIALSNDTGGTNSTDTSLAGELSNTNGLGRTQGTVTLPTAGPSGNQTTVAHTFTYTGSSQQVQKTALFDAASAGNMAHEITFNPRTLLTNDTLTVTFTVTLG